MVHNLFTGDVHYYELIVLKLPGTDEKEDWVVIPSEVPSDPDESMIESDDELEEPHPEDQFEGSEAEAEAEGATNNECRANNEVTRRRLRGKGGLAVANTTVRIHLSGLTRLTSEIKSLQFRARRNPQPPLGLGSSTYPPDSSII